MGRETSRHNGKLTVIVTRRQYGRIQWTEEDTVGFNKVDKGETTPPSSWTESRSTILTLTSWLKEGRGGGDYWGHKSGSSLSGTNCSTSRTSDARVPWYARSSLSFWMEELFHAWNCVRYAVEPRSRVFFPLIYLYFGHEYGNTRNFSDIALEISNYRN